MYTAWVWHPVRPLLERAGHVVLTPDLPGTGDNHAVKPEDATLAIWADFLADLVRSAAAPVFLVGHSRGGHVIGEAAERVPDQIAALVYVTATLSTPGLTMFETMNVGTSEIVPPPQAPSFMVPDEYARARLFNRCTADVTNEAIRRLFPEPLTPAKTLSGVTLERWGRVPRAYIECSDDKSLILDCQRAMQARAPCDLVMTIDSDHSPFLSTPETLTDALLAAARRFARAIPQA
jgi:pimeloyl-ACP methyl ester carboxylesterase